LLIDRGRHCRRCSDDYRKKPKQEEVVKVVEIAPKEEKYIPPTSADLMKKLEKQGRK
jgi:hypothetical protein